GRHGGEAVTRALFAALLLALASLAPAAEPRRIAITVDDLPWVEFARTAPAVVDTRFDRLVASLHGTHAIGFVNEDKLERDGVVDPRRVTLLERWLEGGRDLGNPTYGHVGMHATPIADYLDAIARGERVTRALLAKLGREPRY